MNIWYWLWLCSFGIFGFILGHYKIFCPSQEYFVITGYSMAMCFIFGAYSKRENKNE